jgi:hypothetical protein
MTVANSGIEGKKWRILLLTCRNPATDFRLPIARALQQLGHDVCYVYLKRKPVVVELANPGERMEMSIPGLLSYLMRHVRPARPLLVFNSTNLVFPLFSRLLRAVVGGIWCFDMHDDLLYASKGRDRSKLVLFQRLLLGGSDLIVHCAPTLIEKFPSSHHLGNASDLTPIARTAPDFGRVLVLASIDERMDFDFLARCAAGNPDLVFEIFGQISGDNPLFRADLDAMLSRCGNIVYHGAYKNSDLPDILGRYIVTLAPYVAVSPMTRYIDPLRYYHCLNSGQEVISTAIPKAQDFGSVLHVIDDPSVFGPLVRTLRDDASARKNPGGTAAQYNWPAKAKALMRIVSSRPA